MTTNLLMGAVRTSYTLLVQDMVYTSVIFCWLFSLVATAFFGRISDRKKFALEGSIWPSKSRPNQTLTLWSKLCSQLNRAAPIVEPILQFEIGWADRRRLSPNIVKLLSRVYPKIPFI